MTPVHPAALPPAELLKECTEQRTRRSGPGGQHRNKVETAVVLEHVPTGLRAEASERRSQAENRRVALFRLRMLLALEVRHAAALEPSSLWQSRRRDGRIRVNAEHEDFPAVVAELLDQVVPEQGDLSVASERLEVTASQLIKLLKGDPRALAVVNRCRATAGKHPLK